MAPADTQRTHSILPANGPVPVCLGPTPALQRTLVFKTLAIDSVNRADRYFETASGKSINVARVLRTLGAEPLALGFVGGDVAEAIRSELDAAGIRHNLVAVTAKTRSCTTVLDLSAGTATELVEEPRPVEADAWQRLLAALRQALPSAGVLVLSGSLPSGAPQGFYAECAALAAQNGVPVLLDAAGEPLRRGLAAGPWLVKPNRKELGEALQLNVDSDALLRAALRRLVAAGASWAVTTLGPEGALLSDGRSLWTATQPAIRAVNPIGSGDAVAAGFAAARLSGWPVPEGARLALACGAANALTEIAGHVNPADVSALMEQVKVVRPEG